MGYKVTSAYATLRVRNNLGQEVLMGFYKDAVLPADVNQEDLERHIRKAMVAETAEPAPEPEPVAEPTEPASTETDEGGDKPPAGNASRDTWAAYAASKGAPEEETRPVAEGGLSHADLRTKYGS